MRLINIRMLTLLCGLLIANHVLALEASDTTTYCNNIKTAAKTAQSKYITNRTPSKSPTEVFEDSVTSCMTDIANMGINLSLPGVADGLLEKLFKQLIQKACAAAKGQYESAVSEAQNTVNATTDSSISVSTTNTGTVTTTTNTSTSTSIFNQEVANPTTTAVSSTLK